jgi:hypothetical protein
MQNKKTAFWIIVGGGNGCTYNVWRIYECGITSRQRVVHKENRIDEVGSSRPQNPTTTSPSRHTWHYATFVTPSGLGGLADGVMLR